MWKTRLRVAAGSEPVTIEIDRKASGDREIYSARIDGKPFDFELDETDGGGVLRIQGRIVRFSAVRSRDHVDVWIEGRTYRFQPEQKAPARGGSSATALATTEIAAPMPGSVLKINVKPGDEFEAHKPLVVLESMKMELAPSAPAAGRVAEVLCRAGELVQMGQVLVKLEPPEPSHAA